VLIAALAGKPVTTDAHGLIKSFWENEFKTASGKFGQLHDPEGNAFPSFEKFWRRALHDGYIAGSALPALTVTPSGTPAAAGTRAGADAVEITFSADSTIYDGRFGNNGWLQETPKIVNKVTWDNTAIVGYRYAERLHLQAGQMLEIRAHGTSVRVPVSIVNGWPDNSINLQLGYGRKKAGQVGTGIGYDAYPLRTSDSPWTLVGAEVVATRDSYRLATTQGHFNMEGRAIVRNAPLADYVADPGFAQKEEPKPKRDETLHENPWDYSKGYAWGMSIDLNSCIGCNACMVSCTSENNISVVGKDQVLMSREMHWIRLDRYYEGDPDNPRMHDQPVPCMHCENAPCEVVCPVAATSHSSEGLNDMVYNRCVGTRYCSNNCPYKVRRFNFLLYADWTTPTLKMARNPDVTVRSRGVMEKCTYCVQRISHARIQSKIEDRTIRDGEIQTACQNACPTQAITFGDINNPENKVAKMKAEPRNYGVLEELNTRPRTTYLASVRNPNPELEPASGKTPAESRSDAH
jgi:Fe-S-cluster-containing dehydrogenase component